MKILIAVEDEFFGKAIADFVSEHDWPPGSEFRLIHVLEPLYVSCLAGYPSELMASFDEERRRSAKSLLLGVATQISTRLPQLKLEEEILEGSPKDVIVNMAKDWPAELIVVGSHGRSGIGQFLLGSVSLSVLSAAPCSVMVVKPAKEAKSEKKQAKDEKACVS
ncbi:MAG: universal stress protein [Candidatus Obscuribacterales bacterium]|nr:universal stress protein [Candidatus Obscuribacterales bacterium]